MSDGVIVVDESVQKELDALREKILFALEIFPFISRSMIHMAIGTGTSRGLWSPILDQLVTDRKVCAITVYAKTPTNRNQSFTLYHLPSRLYQPTHDDITFSPADENAHSDSSGAKVIEA